MSKKHTDTQDQKPELRPLAAAELQEVGGGKKLPPNGDPMPALVDPGIGTSPT